MPRKPSNKSPRMPAKGNTTIRLPEPLKTRAKEYAISNGRSLTCQLEILVKEALEEKLGNGA